MAYQVWANTDQDPNTALLEVNNGVYFNHHLALYLKRRRFQQYHDKHFSTKDVVNNENL